jgi:TatD DNase family protein
MIDSHAHLADEAFAGDLDDVILRAREAGVQGVLCVVDVTDPAEAARADGVARRWDGVRTTAGVHPHRSGGFAGRADAAADLVVGRGASDPAVRAIGEVGLDYHYDFAPRDVQRRVFSAQVALARDTGYPLVVHSREADDDTIAILEQDGAGRVRGVFHCFSGDSALAHRALRLGFYVSFSGILTFRGAAALRDAAAIVPLDRLLVETDCPYLAPVPHRGTRNEPARVVDTLRSLAVTHGIDARHMAAATAENYRILFAP